MRWLVFLLVLVNLLFFAYAQGYFGHPDNPDALRMQKQVKPESVRVVSNTTAPAVAPGVRKEEAGDKPAGDAKNGEAKAPETQAGATPPSAPEICLAGGGLQTKEADQLSAGLSEKFADFRLARRTELASPKSWWVFIPPMSSKADADKKAGELKQLGVKDFVVVPDSGNKPLAISLGVFSSETAAKSRLAQLREKGVRSAKMEPYGSKETFLVEIRGPAARQNALLEAVKSLMPSLKLESKTCP